MSLSSVIQTQRVDLMIRGTSSNSDARGYFGNPCSSKPKTKRPTRLWDFDMTTFCAQPGAGDLFATISHILSDIKEWGALIVLKIVCKDLKNLIEPVWSELIGAIDDAHTNFYHARLQLIGRRQTGARMPQPIHGNNSHMTESAVLRWKEHMATMQIVHSREQASKRLFMENAAAVFGHRIASHMCTFLENPSRTGLHNWSPEGCIHSLPFICDGKVNNSFAWHTLTNKCQVHFPLGEPCHHGLSALDRGYSDQGQLFTSVAGADGIQSTVLHCKLACVHSQCVEISARCDFPLNAPARNVEKKSKTARVKQLLAMKGVAAPFERGCVLDALGLLRSASMPPFLWIVDHPSIPTGVSIQSMAQLSNAEVQFVDAQMHLQAKASADRVAADRKIHIDAMMAELDQEIKFSKLPYSSVVEVGQTFNGVPTLFSMAVAAVHDSPPPGWSGSIRETDRVLQLLQLLYRMHAAQECVFNRELSPVSPEALAWFHDLWGVDLPNNVKSCSAWRSAASRPQFDRTWRIPIEEQQESDPRQGDREKFGNEDHLCALRIFDSTKKDSVAVSPVLCSDSPCVAVYQASLALPSGKHVVVTNLPFFTKAELEDRADCVRIALRRDESTVDVPLPSMPTIATYRKMTNTQDIRSKHALKWARYQQDLVQVCMSYPHTKALAFQLMQIDPRTLTEFVWGMFIKIGDLRGARVSKPSVDTA